jgi:NAD+ kinase
MILRLDRVLVVFKKSLYQIYVLEHRDASVRRALRRKDPAAQRMARSHRAQERALELVRKTLDRRGVDLTVRWRGTLRNTKGYDLVIAVGGDGTLLDTAHRIEDDTPLLGINSDPETSVGRLCAATADELDNTLEAITGGRIRLQPLGRIRVRVDGRPVLGPCLNDVLFAHRSPAEMSRFELAGPVAGEQVEGLRSGAPGLDWTSTRNSGLWVCTATGSTAAMRSAAGQAMRPRSLRLQFRVREPYLPLEDARTAPLGGFVARGQALVLVNRMRSARLWGDGVHRRARIEYGQVIVLDPHPVPLRLFRGG